MRLCIREMLSFSLFCLECFFYECFGRSKWINIYVIFASNFRYKRAMQSDVDEGVQRKSYSEFVAMSAVEEFVEESEASTFPLRELEEVFLRTMHEQGHDIESHITRFAERLESADIGLRVLPKQPNQRYFAMKCEGLRKGVANSDWLKYLKHIVRPIRDEILKSQKASTPDMTELCTSEKYAERNCPKLNILMTLLCYNHPRHSDISLELATINDMIVFNTKQTSKPSRESQSTDVRRHQRNTEGFTNHYLTVQLYSVVRSRNLLQILFKHGITLSYDRTLAFIDELSDSVKELYVRSGDKVLPSKLRKGIFTVFTDDNIDKNSSSTSATRHFHGTAVSILQFPTLLETGEVRFRKPFPLLVDSEKHCASQAMDTYLSVPSESQVNSTLAEVARFPIQTTNFDDLFQKELNCAYKIGVKEEDDWLYAICNTFYPEDESTDSVSWTAFHGNKKRDKTENQITINAILPVIDHVSHSKELQYHVMKTSVEYTNYLNPGQVTVGCSDQPLYALKKTIQWSCPELFRSSYFAFMGPLHIEQAGLVCIGLLIKGTGLDEVLALANIHTTGMQTAVCDVNSIKKARYALQLIAAVLMRNLKDAYLHDVEDTDTLLFDDWLNIQQGTSFLYWYNVLQHIKYLMMFVRSFREANFLLLIVSLEKLAILFFALDRHHYSRWVPVFIQDLKMLKTNNTALFNQFMNGFFAVNTAGTAFSKIGYDQTQEHNNKKVKSTAGYIDL